jgi:malate dehydrogenase (oxaloacetate-decarboxylating)(NADP+)
MTVKSIESGETNIDDRKVTAEEALAYHSEGRPGKISILPTKPLMTQRDLSLGYSPGVAVPCLEIQKDPSTAYKYTSKGNMVAVISNGTAVLGLGNLGALASKPVMEGKAILFKRFADIDGIDVEVDTTDIEEFINCVRLLGPTWGGINLEDIASPECFIIEQRLKEIMDIPVFHDDQHGTAIITVAGIINACHITGRDIGKVKVVLNGAGAAGISCIELLKTMGVPHENVIACDRDGVIYKGREISMNQWKSAHAIETPARTLTEALTGADIAIGLSAKGAFSKEMIAVMARNPIVFAMANPDPEITPEEVYEVREDAIVATGRSDYNNQVNNVMGFPYIFRGALDVQATAINEEMKIAAARALAQLAREEVPEEVSAAYSGRKLKYGPHYIIPAPFDPRLITTVPPAVAKAAMDTGVARRPIADFDKYKDELRARLDPTADMLNLYFNKLKNNKKKVIFAEGEEETIIRAAVQWRDNGYGEAVLVGRESEIRENFEKLQITNTDGITIANAAISNNVDVYIESLYERLQRRGYLKRDVIRMVKNDRNTFAACMLLKGEGDLLISGITRNYFDTYGEIRKVIALQKGTRSFGISVMLAKGRTVFIADTAINEVPSPHDLAEIALQTARFARKMGHEPRVAMLSYSNFGNPTGEKAAPRIRDALIALSQREVDFEYDGEMSADVALNEQLQKLYPFCRLSGPANVLIMPALHTAHVSAKLMQELGGVTMIGPILTGFSKPVQIVPMGASVAEIIKVAALASVHIDGSSMGSGHASTPHQPVKDYSSEMAD